MATTHAAVAVPRDRPVPVRRIDPNDLRQSLRDGWQDFLQFRGDIIFAGLLYPLIGLVAAVAMLSGPVVPMFFPIAGGVALMGPLSAIGFYELARRREAGLESGWSHFLDVRKSPSAQQIGMVAGLLITVFALWVVAAYAIYVTLWGFTVPESIGDFLTRLFTTPEGWALIIIGNAVGIAFAFFVLAVAAISLPMLVDRDVSARLAIGTSVRAFRENVAVMSRWGVTILFWLVVGSIPFFLGLAVVLPWLGYATWHLYTRLVDRSAVRERAGEG